MASTYKVKGMHCASCANIITKKVSSLPGVNEISVNPATEKAKIDFDSSKVSLERMNKEIGPLGYTLEGEESSGMAGMAGMEGMDHSKHAMSSDSELVELQTKTNIGLPITFVVFASMLWDIAAKTTGSIPELAIPMEILNPILMVISAFMLFWVGQQFIQGVIRFVRYGAANMDTLIGIGTLSAFIYSALITLFPKIQMALGASVYTYFDVTIVVIGFVIWGKYLEARSKKKTGDAIKMLLNLQAKTALVMRDGKEVEIPVEQVKHGDLIVIKPAGKIPVDGIVTEGSSYVDESMVTGEPIPVSKREGDSVAAGTLNTSGSFTFKATKVGSETLLSNIIRMVEEAQGSRAPIQALADKISGIFVPIVLVLAVITLGLWMGIGTQYLGFSQAFSYGLMSFVGILVIACPCALGLATPTAIIVGVGKGAREGILIKDAATLEKLYKVNTVVMDKTGTLTKGRPELVSVENFSDVDEDKLVSIIASLEKKSEHPIAHAIVSYADEKNISLMKVDEFEAIKGKGIKGTIEGEEYYVGSPKLIEDLKLSFNGDSIEKQTSEGKTPVVLAGKDKVLGVVMVADALKPQSKEAIDRLHKLGIKTVMLTGDNKRTANYIAKQLGIDEVVAEVMPEDKLNKITELQKQGRIVAMAGDGVNDAPALAKADVGIAMATGTDVAIESAGITLLHGDIGKIVKAIRLSKMTMRGIKQNLFWAFIYNLVGIPLAAGLFYPFFGWLLNPIFAGLAMAFSSVSVVGNSLRLKTKKL